MRSNQTQSLIKQIYSIYPFEKGAIASTSAATPNNENVAVNSELLTERQQLIIKTLKEIEKNVAVNVAVNVAINEVVNTKFLAEKLGVNRKTIQRDLMTLVNKNIIRWIGADKNGHWELITPSNSQ